MNEKEVKAIQNLAILIGKELDTIVREKAKLEEDHKHTLHQMELLKKGFKKELEACGLLKKVIEYEADYNNLEETLHGREKAALEQENKELRERNELDSKLLEAFHQDCNGLNEMNERLEEENKELVSANARLKYDYQKMEDKYLQTDFMIACLEDELDKLRKENEDLKNELNSIKKCDF